MRRHWQSSAPVSDALDLDAVKLHLRVDHADDDDLIADLIRAATEQAEAYTGRALITQTWTLLDTAAIWPLSLSRWPVIAVSSLIVDGAQYVTTGVLNSAFTLYAGDDALLEGSGTEVTVVYTAGYGNSYSDLPAAIRQWMLLQIGQWYEHREGTIQAMHTPQKMPFVDHLLTPYRIHLLGLPCAPVS